jgi:hypothetical protein
MHKTNVTKSLPMCLLISELEKKASERSDNDFGYVRELERFCQRVKQDINDIELLFPEYTPHDTRYHLKPLFHLTSEFLGKKLLQELNATELFLLACALYGHDWGMSTGALNKTKWRV